MPGRKPYVDTGHRPSLLGRLLGSRARTITPEDFVEEEMEEVPLPSYALCPREYPVEIAVYLPDGFVPVAGSHEALMRELDSFKEPVGFEVIKKQHRRLAMRHHPDRGGDKESLQAINVAMETIARAHGKR